MNQTWDALLATALMGSDRQTPDFSGLDGSLGHLLNQLDSQDLEEQLLSAAGAIACATQAGIETPIQQEFTFEPCDLEEIPVCCDHASQALQTILTGQYLPVFGELLAYLRTAGQRIPVQSLPALLDFGRSRRDSREAIKAVIGKRGRWLAQLNPDWSYIHAELKGIDASGLIQADELQEGWETGTHATRLELLKTVRQHAPPQGLNLLSSSWKQEKAKDRAAFLDVLRCGLSLEDEPFLEAALDDRSKEVRAIAVDLLSHLPASQLCARMTERIQHYAQVQSTATNLVLTITLPKEEEPRDGLIATSLEGQGQRSSLLQQIVSATPLTWWEAEPKALIRAASKQNWKIPMLMGWLIAAQRQQNLDWARALIIHQTVHKIVPTRHLSELWIILPQPEQEDQWTEWLTRLWSQKKWGIWRKQLKILVKSNLQPSLPFSQFLLEGVERDCQANLQVHDKTYLAHDHWRSLLDTVAYYLHPDILPMVETVTANLINQSHNETYHPLLERFLEVLTFRHHLKQIFEP